jgi:hypothetical protein
VCSYLGWTMRGRELGFPIIRKELLNAEHQLSAALLSEEVARPNL